MRVIGSADDIAAHSSSAPRTSDVGAGKEGHKGIVKNFVDEDGHGKMFSVLFFDPRKYNRDKNRHTIFQADEVTNPASAVFKKHEEKLMESPESSKHQYGSTLPLSQTRL